MTKDKNLGVKEGRTRINFILDDDLLAAIDGIAEIESTTRTEVIAFLLREGMNKRGYQYKYRKYSDFTKYWLECMAARREGSFWEGPEKNVTLKFTPEQEDAVMRSEMRHYEDEWGDGYIGMKNGMDLYSPEAEAALQHYEAVCRIKAKYEMLVESIMFDEQQECRELERKLKFLKENHKLSHCNAPFWRVYKDDEKKD